MQTPEYIFTLPLQVRDYELDSQGIVNNANYQHYFEHTRHEFCRQAGLSFAQMHQQGLDPVVHRIEIVYHHPLRSGDNFDSCLALARRGPLFVFTQDLYRDHTLMVHASVEVASIKDGALTRGHELMEYFGKFIKE